MFTLPPLTYPYNALEPFISSQTLEFHHDKHHQTYVNKLNEILAGYPEMLEMSVEMLLQSLEKAPENLKMPIINNAGQVYNHNLYWEILGPNAGGKPTGELAQKIESTFGTFEKFKEEFANLGLTQFGSGWAWLSVNSNNELIIEKTSNADSPIIRGKTPILTMDVWEHAYYLDYQNKRPDYIAAFWNVVNWKAIESKYLAALEK